MKFIKCKNETEKLKVIADYCNEQIKNNNYNINFLKASKSYPSDYAEEIHELELKNKNFETILKIINADKLTSIMID